MGLFTHRRFFSLFEQIRKSALRLTRDRHSLNRDVSRHQRTPPGRVSEDMEVGSIDRVTASGGESDDSSS